jgi:hypothetical protein
MNAKNIDSSWGLVGSIAAGATQAYSKGGFFTGKSNVYFHPERAFTSAKQLFYTMGHEFIHVSQYAALAGVSTEIYNYDFSEMLEYHAYSYEVSIGSSNYGGFTKENASDFSIMYPDYCKAFHWLNFSWTKTVRFIYPF